MKGRMKITTLAMLAMTPLLLAQAEPDPGPVVKGAPYSAQAITGQKATSMVYRDSDGRERRETAQTVFINDPVAGVSYTIDVNHHTAHRIIPTPAPTGGIRIEGGITITGAMITPQSVSPITVGTVVGVSQVEHLGTMTIEGLEAEGTRSTTPAGQITERWYSPDLKAVVLTKRNGDAIYRLTQISQNEPAHALFEIPAEYTVVP